MYEKNIDIAFYMLLEEFGNLEKEFNEKAKVCKCPEQAGLLLKK